MRTAPTIGRKELADRLHALCTDFRFTLGRPARRSDGVIDVSVDRTWDEEGLHVDLVTVFISFPPGPEVKDLAWSVQPTGSGTGRTYRTDRRGQFWLNELSPGEYELRFEGFRQAAESRREPNRRAKLEKTAAATDEPGAPWSLAAEVHFALAAAAKTGRRPLLEFHHESLPIDAVLWDDAGVLTLGVNVGPGHQGDGLVRFTLSSRGPQAKPVQGFVGLYESSPGGRWTGEISLEALDDSLAEKIKDGCDVEVAACPLAGLRQKDRECLERSAKANLGPRSAQRILTKALEQLAP